MNVTPQFATIDPYILAFSAITVIVTVWMGFRSAKPSKTASDFFVAGRSVSVGWNASAISGEYLSAASFMGVAGMVMSSGYDALWYPVCYACGYLFLLLFIAGPLRRFGAYTIPDFAEGRYDSPLFRKIAVVFVLFIGFFYTMPQMKGAGTTLAYIFPGMPYWGGVVLVGAVITLNVALGGMKGITLVQAFQYWIKMFAISVPIFVLMSVYGHYGKQLELNGNNQQPTTNIQHPSLPQKAPAIATGVPETLKWREVHPNEVGPKRNVFVKTFSNLMLKLRGKSTKPTITFSAAPPGSLPQKFLVEGLLQQLSGVKGERYIISEDLNGSFFDYTAPTNALSGALWVKEVEKGLTNSDVTIYKKEKIAITRVALVREPNGIVRVLSLENLPLLTASAMRKPLPEKAPKDETWIAPFGPLTTKAAKAAKLPVARPELELRLSKAGFVKDVYAPASMSDAAKGVWDKTRPGGVTYGLPGTNGPIRAILNFCVSNRLLELSEVSVYIAPELTNAFISYPSGQIFSALNFKSGIVEIFQTNGFRLDFFDGGKVLIVDRSSQPSLTVGTLPPASVRTYSLLYTYSLIIALVCGTAGLPHILVRFYTNPDGVAAKRTTMWVMILIGVFYVFPPIFGVMGRNLLPELYNATGAKGTDKVVLELPRILNEKGSTGASPVTVGALADGSERSTATDGAGAVPQSKIENQKSKIPWGSILSGITCAGAFAAFMSTFSGLLVSMTGALAHDVYGRMLRPKSTPEQRMRAFKFCAVLIGGVAMVLGCFVEPLEINFMVGQAFAIAAASYFPLLFMSVWWRGMTMKGAAIGMLTGGVCALVAAALTNFSNLALDKGPMGKVFAVFAPLNDFWAAHPLLRILCEQPAIWTVPLAITLMIVVSKLAQKDVPPDIRMKMLVLHAPEKLGLKQEYIQEHQGTPGH